MRRRAILTVLAGVGLLVLRARGAALHERLAAHCEAMFERMPDTFPPKKMMRSIEEIRVTTSRILELVEADEEDEEKADAAQGLVTASSEEVHHAA